MIRFRDIAGKRFVSDRARAGSAFPVRVTRAALGCGGSVVAGAVGVLTTTGPIKKKTRIPDLSPPPPVHVLPVYFDGDRTIENDTTYDLERSINGLNFFPNVAIPILCYACNDSHRTADRYSESPIGT